MLTVVGKTFEHRYALKRMGGKYDGRTKTWTIPDNARELVLAKGLSVREAAPQPQPQPRTSGLLTRGDALHAQDYLSQTATKNRLISLWSSPEALAAHIAPINGDSTWNPYVWSETEDRKDFSGTKSMQEAVSLALTGWPEGANKAAALRDKIKAEAPMARKLKRHSVAGIRPNVPRYLAGDPAHMVQYETSAARNRPIITLVNDLSTQAIVPKEALFNRACVVAAIVDTIEAAGYACGVIGMYEAANIENSTAVGAVIKEPEQPADIGRIAFSGHPSMLRRLLFALVSSENHIRGIGSGLGAPASVAKTPLPPNAYRLEAVTSYTESLFKSEAAAISSGLKMLLGSLRSQGCTAIPEDSCQT